MFWRSFVKVLGLRFSKAAYSKAAGFALICVSLLLVLQFYFVRELLTGELLLGLIFSAFCMLAGIVYAIGLASDLGLQAIAVKIHSRPALRLRRPL